MSIELHPYGTLPSGEEIQQATLQHARITCKIITYGGIITELWIPDREGTPGNVVLGLPSLEAYLAGHPYFNAITGRIAGRINGGTFSLEGKDYAMVINDGPNHLHGGLVGLDKRVWTPSISESEEGEPSLTLTYHSPNGEEGYPGNVDLRVTYTLTEEAVLRITYGATTDQATPLSLTNHAYFNLAGEGHPTIADHTLQILTGQVVWKDEEGTLEEQVSRLDGTPHDFRSPKSLGEFIQGPVDAHGENYLLRSSNLEEPALSAVLTDPGSGRIMETHTTTTSLQLYTAKFLDEMNLTGISGKPYLKHGAVCLECQGFPNAVNSPEIDDIIVRPGKAYHQITEYRFRVD